MKTDSILINTTRGAIVDEDPLYSELRNKRLSAAFDVYWRESYTGKLIEFYPHRIFITPHVASTCSKFLIGCKYDLNNPIKEFI